MMLPELRTWQKSALEVWAPSKRGVVKVVTGGGKTVFGLSCYAEARKTLPNLKLLIVVPTIPLSDQWSIESKELLELDEGDLSIYGGGNTGEVNSSVHIAVINTARNIVNDLTSSGDWMLIVDECHRAGSEENRKVLYGNFYATLGLSATPERQYDDWFEEVIEPALGPIIFEYSYADALRDGVLSPFSLHNYEIPLTGEEIEKVQKTETAIAIKLSNGYDITDKALKLLFLRRARISQQAIYRIPTVVSLLSELRGLRGLVFHESIDAANQITELLKEQHHRVEPYHSKISHITRMRNLLMFRNGLIDLLVTCKALDEGLDVPDAEIGIIAASTSSNRQRIQRMGRVLRPAEGKDNARILTIFALETEKNKLEIEIADLEGLAESFWYKAEKR